MSKQESFDTSDYLNKIKSLLSELKNIDDNDSKRKSEVIKRLVEVAQPLVVSGAIKGYSKPQDTASYLWNEIVKYNVRISYRHFIRSVPENLRRKYSKSDIVSHLEHDFLKTDEKLFGKPVRRCECGTFEVDGVVYEQRKESEQDEEKSDEEIVRESAQLLSDEEERERAGQRSPILLGIVVSKQFLKRYLEFVKRLEEKARDPEILKDWEESIRMQYVAELLTDLQYLYDPPEDQEYATQEEGTASIMNQLMDETNFRAPATILQQAMAKALSGLVSYRKWAHNLSISPRQFQRVRKRLDSWPEKKPEIVIRNVLGSVCCPNCRYNLVANEPQKAKKKDTVSIGKKQFKIPEKYQSTNLNYIEILWLEFARKLVPKKYRKSPKKFMKKV